MTDVALYRDADWLFDQVITQGKTIATVAQEFGWTWRVVEKWVQIYGLGDNNFRSLKRLSPQQEELVRGSILGDGHIAKNDCFIVSHCAAQHDYLFWKYELLKDCCKRAPAHYAGGTGVIHGQVCDYQDSWRFNTRRLDDLHALRGIDTAELITHLSDFSAAIWFLDDGYRDKWTWDLCLGNLNDSARQATYQWLRDHNLDFAIRKDKRYIRLHNQSSRDIDQLILANIPAGLDIVQKKIGNKGGDAQ